MGKDTWSREYATYLPGVRDRRRVSRFLSQALAFWKMYGLDLPDEVLRKVYYRNAFHRSRMPSSGWPHNPVQTR